MSYDAASNNVIFSFNSAAGDIASGTVTVTATALSDMVAAAVFEDGLDASTQSVAFDSRDESLDTYVFEATAAMNGADTLNNVDAGDALNFTAFLGAGAVVFDTQDLDAGEVAIGNGDVSVAFGKASLVVADLDLTGFTDGHKAVVLLSADVDGLVPVGVDVTNNAYQAYYVENGADVGNADVTITLVGTINSAVELTAAQAGGLI
ncbi:MAG: hypothetical protein IPP59_19875 [Betaproteobacteria bacterium]|nr:hypothetical protein [Candidatus Dechloromonas phosphorivorans]